MKISTSFQKVASLYFFFFFYSRADYEYQYAQLMPTVCVVICVTYIWRCNQCHPPSPKNMVAVSSHSFEPGAIVEVTWVVMMSSLIAEVHNHVWQIMEIQLLLNIWIKDIMEEACIPLQSDEALSNNVQSLFNPSGGSFMVQKMGITSPIPAFEGLMIWSLVLMKIVAGEPSVLVWEGVRGSTCYRQVPIIRLSYDFAGAGKSNMQVNRAPFFTNVYI